MHTRKDSQLSARELVENALRLRHPLTVRQLVKLVTTEGGLAEYHATAIVTEMAADGSLTLQEPEYQLKSPWDYFLSPTLSMWLWASSGAVAFAVAAILLVPDSFPLGLVRWAAGSVLALLLPGYALLQLLFPTRKAMDSLEHFALDVGLSLALVPVIGLVLNFTPWGIRFIPVTISISAFTIVLLTGAALRKYSAVRKQNEEL